MAPRPPAGGDRFPLPSPARRAAGLIAAAGPAVPGGFRFGIRLPGTDETVCFDV
jgi:hypothetical protein